MTEERDHEMDPAGSAREEDILHVQSLVKRITHASDSRTISVGLNTIRAIVEGNPFLCQLTCYEGFIDELSRAKEALQARELADSVCSRDSTPQRQQTEISAKQPPPQQTGLSVSQQRLLQREGFSTPLPRSPSPSPLSSDRHSPAAFLAAMWLEDEEETVTPASSPVFPVTSVPSSRRRRRPRRRSSTAEQASLVGESDCASLTQPEFSDPGLHDLSTTVSNSVLPAIVLPESGNSATLCLDSKDVIPSDTSVPNYSPVALTSDPCVFEPSDSCNARSNLPELADMNVSPVELTEPRTVILHQTHLHTATSIVAPQNCFNQPVCSEVSQSELSHTPPPSALDVTVHAVEHKPSETECSIGDAPSNDCFMFQPVLSLDISDIAQPTSQPATALSAPHRVTVNEACVAEQANLPCTLSVLPEPGDTDY